MARLRIALPVIASALFVLAAPARAQFTDPSTGPSGGSGTQPDLQLPTGVSPPFPGERPMVVPQRPPACVPATCESKGRACGLILDGCGEIIDCGVCPTQGIGSPPQAMRPMSDFVDTRINVTLTDENVLAKPGTTNPNEPGLRIGTPNSFGILFFDNYDTRYTGYENLTHLVMYKKMEKGHWVAEGALAIRLLEFSDVNISTIDDSSYIRVAYNFDPEHKKIDNISLTAFPLSSDRMRLGYSYRLSWGGSPIFFKFNPDLPPSATPPVNSAPAPGARLQYTSDAITLWAGFKSSTLLDKNPSVSDQVAIYGFLAGFSYEAALAGRNTLDPLKIRFDLNGGYFDRGNNPNFYPTTTVGPGTCIITNTCYYPDFPVWTAGASAQISLWRGLPPSLSLDYLLFKNDPFSAVRYFARPVYKPGFNWLFQTEFTYMGTSVQNFDAPSSTTVQFGYAGDINVRIQAGHNRVKLDASTRSLEFMLVNQPSLVPYTSLPANSTVNPEQFVSLGYDYNFQRIGLTLGPTLGWKRPANITPPNAIPQLCGNVTGALCTPSTIVVRGEGDYSILPLGKPAQDIWAVKLAARLDFLDFFAAILDVYYQHDPNQTTYTKEADGTSGFDFNHPDSLGFNLTLQARF